MCHFVVAPELLVKNSILTLNIYSLKFENINAFNQKVSQPLDWIDNLKTLLCSLGAIWTNRKQVKFFSIFLVQIKLFNCLIVIYSNPLPESSSQPVPREINKLSIILQMQPEVLFEHTIAYCIYIMYYYIERMSGGGHLV